MNAARRSLVVLLLGAAFASAPGTVLAQRQRPMDAQQRERLREDLKSAPREVYRGQGPERGRAQGRGRRERMTPAERAQLRRDIMDANRNLRGKSGR
jgi:hypothetical protein